MRIAVVGAFCTGKTTLVNDIAAELDQSKVIADECRPFLDRFEHVDWSRIELRSYLIVRQLFVEADIFPPEIAVIVDGGVINNLAHDRALLAAVPSRTDIMSMLSHKRYDLVLRCSPKNVELVDDGQRTLDPELRCHLDAAMADVLSEYRYDAITMEGDRRERLAVALGEIRRTLGR